MRGHRRTRGTKIPRALPRAVHLCSEPATIQPDLQFFFKSRSGPVATRPENHGSAGSSPTQCGRTYHPDVRRIPTYTGTGPAHCADR
uniref:Uncharacterized protein n=1 Tax=Glossina palpalis gambiensis TaxID=67801 RepID=A0A1B0C6X6_9MUSC